MLRPSLSCLVSFFVTSALVFPVFAQNAPLPSKTEKSPEAAVPVDSGARLPVRRVVLYKNGVGYFEHTARVHGNQELNIDFTTGQLNDVLKSLTVVDLGEGHISGIRYNSIAPLDERLKSLRLPFGEQLTQADFLSALRGARVEVRSGSATAAGKLLSVENEQRTTDKGVEYTVTKLSVITDAGEMRNFELGPATSVRLAERDLNDEVGKYLNLIGSSRARDLRRMTISATGSGDRNIFVSYISEVPVWKSTYRIILPEKADEKPLLQGWAIVDNTVGEDWKDVQLSLIAGAPQSFIENISQPYYTRRPVIALPPSVMLTPQEHEGTLTALPGPPPPPGVAAGVGGGIGNGIFHAGPRGLHGTVTDSSGAVVGGARVTITNRQTGSSQTSITDARGVFQAYGLPSGTYRISISSPGFRTIMANATVMEGRTTEANVTLSVGSATETVEVTSEAAAQAQAVNGRNFDRLEQFAQLQDLNTAIANQPIEAASNDLGDYFEYNIKQPITIGKNQSALVPILQAHVEAEKVSIWNENSREIRRALWLTNSSGLTLDSGTFNVLDRDTFAGEGLIETVHPAERRLISFAGDPALRVSMETEFTQKPATHVRIMKGMMILTREQRDKRKYTLHNADTQPRQVIIEHPAREGWNLASGAKPEETTASFLRFRVAVGPSQTEELKIEEFHLEFTQYELTNLDDDQVALITKETSPPPALQDIFRKVLAQKNQISGLEVQIRLRQSEVESITRDQARLRENMKVLKGSPEEKALLLRYTRQLDSQEDRLNTLNSEISGLQQKRDQAVAELDSMVQQVVLDQDL
ncbi:MAG TPA: carboxypeptidase regulatory-like domain-containing protein [Terriglobales bacterium]|nr:carboxypeptidase regulatory-like domain-containing protein [Terriglobales bacterium]